MWAIRGEDTKGVFIAVIAVDSGIVGIAPGGFEWCEGRSINDVVHQTRMRGWSCVMVVPPASRGNSGAGSAETSGGSTASIPSTEASTK